jgi:hypothetical protein
MLRCSNGHDNADGNAFCSTCGQKLEGGPPPPPAPDEPDTAAGTPDTAAADDGATGVDGTGAAQAYTVPGTPAAATGGPEASTAPAADDSGADESVDAQPAGKRRTGRYATLVAAVVVVGAATAFLLGPSTEDRYLAELADEGVRDEFSTEVAAVRNAERLCEDLRDGGDAVGNDADRIGVVHYCDEFADEFRVLQTVTVSGTFVLLESGGRSNVFRNQSEGDPCQGASSGGYSDISAGTTVTVSNLAGAPIDRTALGIGAVRGTNCRFTFELTVTEGEEGYVLEVGRRGDSTYTFEEFTEPGRLAFQLG